MYGFVANGGHELFVSARTLFNANLHALLQRVKPMLLRVHRCAFIPGISTSLVQSNALSRALTNFLRNDRVSPDAFWQAPRRAARRGAKFIPRLADHVAR